MSISTHEEPCPAWHGWLWEGGAWERVCEAAGMRDCSRLLGEMARRRGIPDKLTVMTTGAAPSFVPKSAAAVTSADTYLERNDP